jgi:hypothetical protein
MSDPQDLEDLEETFDALLENSQSANAVLSEFTGEISRLQSVVIDTGRDVARLERGLSRGLRKAFDGVFLDGMKASDALRQVGQALMQSVYSAAVKPVTDQLGGVLAQGIGDLAGGLLPFEKGGSFSQGRVMPFAKGGVISNATAFPMRSGVGLMGEAGPEAIMPLARGADGSLGVRAQAGQQINVTMNIQTPDVQGFQRSQSQIAARLSRALSVGNRNR